MFLHGHTEQIYNSEGFQVVSARPFERKAGGNVMRWGQCRGWGYRKWTAGVWIGGPDLSIWAEFWVSMAALWRNVKAGKTAFGREIWS